MVGAVSAAYYQYHALKEAQEQTEKARIELAESRGRERKAEREQRFFELLGFYRATVDGLEVKVDLPPQEDREFKGNAAYRFTASVWLSQFTKVGPVMPSLALYMYNEIDVKLEPWHLQSVCLAHYILETDDADQRNFFEGVFRAQFTQRQADCMQIRLKIVEQTFPQQSANIKRIFESVGISLKPSIECLLSSKTKWS